MNPIYNAFVYVVWFITTYYLVFFSLALLTKKDFLYEKRKNKTNYKPLITLLVPAYNEESKIAETIDSLKKINYDLLEFIIINDGSKDHTSKVVNKNIKGDKRFRFIDRKTNKGKAASLNEGIEEAKGELIGTMDADSVVEENIFDKVLPYFADRKVGSVTVSVEIKNPKKFLHRIIDLEFIIGLSLFLKALSWLNAVFVTPGPFSVYRKSVLQEIGGFDEDNITEDLEVAYRIHKGGYKIENCMEGRVKTIAPETFKEIYVQRRRWYSGAIQTLMKHKKMLFKKKFGAFGFVMPYNYILIFLGLTLFLASMYLGLSNSLDGLLHFQYTNFNFFERMFDWEFDILAMGRVSIIGMTSFIAGIGIMILGLILSKKKMRTKKLGIIGYPLLFFLYQIFWIGAIISVIRGKKVKWR